MCCWCKGVMAAHMRHLWPSLLGSGLTSPVAAQRESASVAFWDTSAQDPAGGLESYKLPALDALNPRLVFRLCGTRPIRFVYMQMSRKLLSHNALWSECCKCFAHLENVGHVFVWHRIVPVCPFWICINILGSQALVLWCLWFLSSLMNDAIWWRTAL